MRTLIALLLFANVFLIQAKPPVSTENDDRVLHDVPDEAQNFEPRRTYGVVEDFTEIPFIATLISTESPKMFGNGVIIGAHWGLFRAREVKKIKNILNTTFIHIAVLNWFNTIPGENGYKIEKMITHPNYVEGQIDYDIALFKVCHRMNLNKYATVPGPGTLYPAWKLVDVITDEEGPIGYGSMYIYPQSFCITYCPSNDPTKHYVTQIGGPVGWEPNENIVEDGAPFGMSKNDFLGFIVAFKENNASGTSYYYTVQRAEVYKSWVDATAV